MYSFLYERFVIIIPENFASTLFVMYVHMYDSVMTILKTIFCGSMKLNILIK